MLGVDPAKYFEQRGTKPGPLEMATAPFSLSAGNDQQIIAGATGVELLIMGFDVISTTGTNGIITFEDGSGGSDLYFTIVAPLSTATPWGKEVIYVPYFKTTAGNGLYADVTTAAVKGAIYYIAYTP